MMMLAPADLAVISIYFIFLLYFAYLTRRNKTFNEFAVAKHSVPAILVFASLATTIVGPGFSIGFTSKAWSSGYLYYLLVIPYAAQVILVGIFLAPKLSQYRDCRSLGDVMRKKYGAFTQVLTGLISVGLCIGFAAVMGKVGGSTLRDVAGWPLGISIAVITGATALVTFSGGLRATIATESLQFSLKAVVVPILVLVAVVQLSHPIAVVAQRADDLSIKAFEGLNFWQILGISLSFMLGEALIPPYANRALAAKTGEASRSGFILAGLFCLVWLAMVAFLGVVAHSYLSQATAGDNVFVDIGRKLLPSGVFGFLLATIIALIMSSQESVLNSAAVAFTSDILAPIANVSDRFNLIAAKVATLVSAGIAIYAAQFSPSIIDGLLILYSVWAPTIIVPLVAGLFIERTRPLAGWLSIIAGGGSSILWQNIATGTHAVPAILIGLIAALVAYAAGHALGRPIKKLEATS